MTTETSAAFKEYFKPIWRWSDAIQNDFAARADWCVKSYKDANHPPVVKLVTPLNIKAKPGSKIHLSAKGTTDPDGNKLSYNWWQYKTAETYKGVVDIKNAKRKVAWFKVPENATNGETIHIVCEVKDNGIPQLTRYQRVVITVD